MALWAIGTQQLGMSDAEWRALTPRLLLARIKQHRVDEHTKDLRVGFIAAQLFNTQRTKESDRIWVASDFFPDPDADGDSDENEDCDIEGIKNMFRRMRPELN